ncbi:sugar ABC transporter ATP-binding protein, partial [Rhizobium ruizarguesonis]
LLNDLNAMQARFLRLMKHEIVQQDLALCNNLTAAAKVFLGRELRRGVWPLRILDQKSMYKRAAEIFRELKSETRARDLV